MWIELLNNPLNTYSLRTETPDSCFDLTRSHQQYYTVISITRDRTSVYRLLRRNSTTEPSVHSAHKWRQINKAWLLYAHLTWICLASYTRTLYRGHGNRQSHVFLRGFEIRVRVIIMTPRARILINIFLFK